MENDHSGFASASSADTKIVRNSAITANLFNIVKSFGDLIPSSTEIILTSRDLSSCNMRDKNGPCCQVYEDSVKYNSQVCELKH